MKLAVLVYLWQDYSAAGLFSVNTAGRPVSHTFSYYAQYSTH